MTKSYFPIKTETACQLKWTWSSIFLNRGTTSSCHRVGEHAFSLEDFDQFHNTPEKLDQRKTMLRGEWPQPLPYMDADEGCRYCQKIEEAGGQSDRQFHFQIPGLVPPELDKDPTEISVTPRILEVFLNNTCNLSCTYCSAPYSSQIENENIKFGRFERNGLIIESVSTDREKNKLYVEKFFLWLENNYQELRRLHLLGGEPLYQKEFYQCLEFIEKHSNSELEFNLITNLMIDTDKFETLVQRWKSLVATRKIKRLDITISIDCWGPEQEYARYGLNLDQFERNVAILLKNPWIYLNVNSSLTPLTLRKFPALIDKINAWRQFRKVNHHFQKVFRPSHHSPDIFGPKFWIEDLDHALAKMPQTDWQEKNAYNYLSGIKTQIQSSCINTEKIVKLITHLDELDRRRGTDWRKLFGYLEDYQKYVV